jgi:Dullard-like phosphatase family protein
MSKREKNNRIEKSSFLTSNNFNTSIPIILSSNTTENINNNININKIKSILESHNKAFHKRSHSTYNKINSSKNSQNKINSEHTTNIPTPLNKYFTSTNRSKENMNIRIENNETIGALENNYTQYQTSNNFNNINTNNDINNRSQNKNETKKCILSLSPNIISYKKNKKFLLPKKTSNKKTLVLDLDETLVHSVGEVGDNNGSIPKSDFTIQVPQNNSSHDVHVMVRPHVEEFLERMSKRYELVIFTASISKYANPLLNIVDKMGHVPFRLFREHCTLINTAFVKDLSLLGRDFKDIIILDNNPTAYSLNHYNGFPIKSWFDDKKDDELLKICPILEFLSYVPDVRDYIKKIVVQNKVKFDLVKQIIINYKNSLKKSIVPAECRKIYDLFNEEKNTNLYNNNNFDKIMQKSKSTKISIIKPSLNITNKYYNNKKINNFTNINIVNKSTKYNRIFHLEDLNNSINISKQNPVKIKNLNMKVINHRSKEKIIKKKDNYNNKNEFLKKKKIVTNTMRYHHSKNKIFTSKNSKNISTNYIINNINNININISSNYSDNKNNMTENININNNADYLKNKKIVFSNNNFNKSNKVKSPKFINTRSDIIDINKLCKENSENKNELNISKKSKNSKNKVKFLNIGGGLKLVI